MSPSVSHAVIDPAIEPAVGDSENEKGADTPNSKRELVRADESKAEKENVFE